MKRYLIVMLLVAGAITMYGCDKLPEWLQFVKPKEPQPVQEQQVEGTVLASANGRIITLEEFTEYINAYNQEIQASADIPDDMKETYTLNTFEQKKQILEGMVERELIIAEAIDRAYDKDKELLVALEALEEQLLYAKVIGEAQRGVSISAQEVETYYTSYADLFKVPEERRASMIVVTSEDKANEILIQLLQGANFAVLARQNSTDQSASKGGDIGFIVRQTPISQEDKKTMFQAFEEMAFSLEKNRTSTVFKGPGGYYIVKVTEIKEARQMPLADVYSNIEQWLLQQKQATALQSLVGNLRKAGNIIVYDELLR